MKSFEPFAVLSARCLSCVVVVFGMGCAPDDGCVDEESAGCAETFIFRSMSEVDGNGVLVWVTSGELPYKQGTFQVGGGLYEFRASEAPRPRGYQVEGGAYHVGQLAVVDPTIFNLHSFPDGELTDQHREAMETAVGAHPEAFATSCNFRIVHRDGDPSEPSWISEFAEGYSCARVVGLEDQRLTFEPMDCGELVLQQGECLGRGGT